MTVKSSYDLSSLLDMHSTFGVLDEVAAERGRQDRRFGLQSQLGSTGGIGADIRLTRARSVYADMASRGQQGWAETLDEEVCEALAEVDLGRLRAELVQVAACAVGFVEAIDRRKRWLARTDDTEVTR